MQNGLTRQKQILTKNIIFINSIEGPVFKKKTAFNPLFFFFIKKASPKMILSCKDTSLPNHREREKSNFLFYF